MEIYTVSLFGHRRLDSPVQIEKQLEKLIQAIGYYGGEVAGVAAIYRAVDEVGGFPIRSVYSVADLPDYESYDYRECPYCKKGRKIDALVNSFGYSAI